MRRVVILGPGAGALPGNFGAALFNEHFEHLFSPNYQAITEMGTEVNGITHAALVDDFVLPEVISKQNDLVKHAGNSIKMALYSAYLAATNLNLLTMTPDGLSLDFAKLPGLSPFNVGTFVGVGWSDAPAYDADHEKFLNGNGKKMGAYSVLRSMPNGAAATVALMLRARGKSETISNACASSLDAFGNAFHYIQSGRGQMAFVLGVESINAHMITRFSLLHALSKKGVSIPFGEDRDGFVMGEGCGFMILVDLESVLRWDLQKHILAEVVGYSASNDACSMFRPNFDGGFHAVESALDAAYTDYGFGRRQVNVVSAHGTSTDAGDINEADIINQIFASLVPRVEKIFVGSIKAALGHTIGASGLFTLWLLSQVIKNGKLPSMGNYKIDPKCSYDCIQYPVNGPINGLFTGGLADAFGFGGHNATVVLREYES